MPMTRNQPICHRRTPTLHLIQVTPQVDQVISELVLHSKLSSAVLHFLCSSVVMINVAHLQHSSLVHQYQPVSKLARATFSADMFTLLEADLMEPIFLAIMADVYQTPGAAAPVEGKIKIFLALFRCSYFSLWFETCQFTILTSFNHTEL